MTYKFRFHIMTILKTVTKMFLSKGITVFAYNIVRILKIECSAGPSRKKEEKKLTTGHVSFQERGVIYLRNYSHFSL